MKFKSSSSKGFTLIELLVVVAIISLLSSVVLASLKDARDKARGSRYIQQALQIKTALELYKDDNGKYPSEEDLATHFGTFNFYTDLESDLVDKYIPSLPDNWLKEPAGNNPELVFYTPGIQTFNDSGYGLFVIEITQDDADTTWLTCGGKVPTSYIFAFYSDVKLNFAKLGYITGTTVYESGPLYGAGGASYLEQNMFYPPHDQLGNWYCLSA